MSQSQYSRAADDFAIGIDLGSSKISVGVLRNGHVEMISDEGENAIPSCVAFTNRTLLVGRAARRQAISNPKNTIVDPIRLLGWSLNDLDLQRQVSQLPFDVVSTPNERLIKVRYRNLDICLRPLEIVAVMLAHAKRIAENYLQGKVSGAVITFSSGLSLCQRELVKAAASVANLQLWAVLSDSTACIVAHETITTPSVRSREDRLVLAINVGSGRTDITLVEIVEGIVELKAVADNPDWVGDYFVRRIANHVLETTPRLAPLKTIDNPRVLRQLQGACKSAMHDLSFREWSSIHIDSFLDGRDLDIPISRTDFEAICNDLPKIIPDRLQRVLADGRVDRSRIGEIILAGGASRIPMIQVAVSDFFNGKSLSKPPNVDEAATYGASILASGFSHKPGARWLPMEDFLLLDVYPHSLSVMTEGDGQVEKVVVRNTIVPTKKTHKLLNAETGQSRFTFQVYEGERQRAKDNQLVGTVSFPITPAPKGQITIELEFDIDYSYTNEDLVQVTAHERGSRIPHKIKYIWERQTSEGEIAKMIVSARQFEHDDILEQDRIRARNALERYVHAAREFVQHTGNHPSSQPAKALLQSTTAWMEKLTRRRPNTKRSMRKYERSLGSW
ncbi:heat shock protein 70 [Acephala macrosclerotiorum]|nr:heat shock protein 70 [Acephala macrosclerotiorum]